MEHLKGVKRLHEEDLRAGYGRVYLPHALARKYPRAPTEWGWQFVFPAPQISRDPRSGEYRRHNLHERPSLADECFLPSCRSDNTLGGRNMTLG